jgi:hypothetical protein
VEHGGTAPRNHTRSFDLQNLKGALDTMEVREPLKTADPEAPPITRRDVLNCQIAEWYPKFSKHTLKTKFIELRHVTVWTCATVCVYWARESARAFRARAFLGVCAWARWLHTCAYPCHAH